MLSRNREAGNILSIPSLKNLVNLITLRSDIRDADIGAWRHFDTGQHQQQAAIGHQDLYLTVSACIICAVDCYCEKV